MPPKRGANPRNRNETPEERRARLQREQQPQPPRAEEEQDALSDEEEPEGEDLFGEDYLRDYESDAESSADVEDDDDIPEEGEVAGDGAAAEATRRNAARRRAATRSDGYEDDGFIVDDDELDEDEGGELSFAARAEVERRLEARHREEREALQQQYAVEDRQRRRDERRRARQGMVDAALMSSTSDSQEESESDMASDDEGNPSDRMEGSTLRQQRRRESGGKRGRDEDSDDVNDGGRRRRAGRAGGRGAAAASNAAVRVQQLFGISIRDTPESAAKYALEDELYLNDNLADEVPFDWTKPQGALVDWLATELPKRVAKNRIFHFLSTFSRDAGSTVAEGEVASEGRFTYREALASMVQSNDQSFELSYWDLGAVYGSTLAIWLADVPEILIGLIEEAANYLLFRILFPHYERIHKHVFVRLSSLPVCDPIRDFRQIHMNVIVRVEGVVIRRSPIYPQLQAVKYDCARCSFIIGPIVQRGDKEVTVSQCPSCHSKGPFRVNMALTEYRNHQTIVLQEPPGKVPPGRLPRSLEVVLTNDLIDRANPGEEVEVTGVYTNSFDPVLNSKQGFPVFTTILNANNISRRMIGGGDSNDQNSGSGSNQQGRGIFARLPDADKQVILKLSQHPNIKQKLLQSIAPSIHGREDIKLGLLLSLLGGVPKDVGGDQSHKIRGDLNVLLVGDPGCAKSQFLKFVEMTADRAVFTTGRGSTAVGLTAALHKDPITGDFTLEGGALVIADRGICLIDEFDKMSDADRTSIHEAMEQQTISVAKGGIVTTLSARCSVIAAANPIGGRYDPSVPFDANVNLTTPILSRFDMLFVVRDEIDPEADLRLATFICGSHFKNHPTTQEEQKQKENAIAARTTELRQQFRQLDEAEVHLAQEIEECTTRIMQFDDDNDALADAGEDEHGLASEAAEREATLERHRQLTNHSEEVQALKGEILAELQQLTEQQKPGSTTTTTTAAVPSRQGTTVEDLDCSSPNPLPQRVLRQYIAYARHHCTPRVANIDSHMITRVYTELRQESKLGGLPITVRHMESLVRLTEAHARIHLRGFAVDEDVTAAVAVFLRCFLATQKYSARVALTKRFDKYLHRDKEPLQLIHFRVKLMVAQTRQLERQVSGGVEPVTVRVEIAEVEALAAAVGVGKDTVASYLKSPTFSQEFDLVYEDSDGGRVPRYITHTVVPE